MQTPTNSGPAASTSLFNSRACMSPAWFSIATLTPASMTFEREFLSTATIESMCFSMPPRRSAPLPSTARTMRRAHDLRGVDHPRQLFFGGALRLVEHRRRRTDRSHADLEIEPELVGVGAHLAQVVGFEVAEEPDLAEVHDLDVPLRGEVHLLERRPVLRAETVHVHAEPHRSGRRLRSSSGSLPCLEQWRRAPVWPRPGFSRTSVDLPACHPLWARNPSLSSRGRNWEQGKILHTAATLQRPWILVDFGRRRSTCM